MGQGYPDLKVVSLRRFAFKTLSAPYIKESGAIMVPWVPDFKEPGLNSITIKPQFTLKKITNQQNSSQRVVFFSQQKVGGRFACFASQRKTEE